MKVFEIIPEIRAGNYVYRPVVPVPDEDSDRLLFFDGTSKADRWVRAERGVRFLDTRRPLAPFLPCSRDSTFAVVGASGLETTRVLENCGELLEVDAPDGLEIALVNVGPAVSCLDLKKTIGTRLPDGDLVFIDKYVFHPEKLPSCSIFKCAERPNKIFALQSNGADGFKAMVERNGYRGLSFREVWNDER